MYLRFNEIIDNCLVSIDIVGFENQTDVIDGVCLNYRETHANNPLRSRCGGVVERDDTPYQSLIY